MRTISKNWRGVAAVGLALGIAGCDVVDPLEGVEVQIQVKDMALDLAALGTIELGELGEVVTQTATVNVGTFVQSLDELQSVSLGPESFEVGVAPAATTAAGAVASGGGGGLVAPTCPSQPPPGSCDFRVQGLLVQEISEFEERLFFQYAVDFSWPAGSDQFTVQSIYPRDATPESVVARVEDAYEELGLELPSSVSPVSSPEELRQVLSDMVSGDATLVHFLRAFYPGGFCANGGTQDQCPKINTFSLKDFQVDARLTLKK